MHRAAPIALLVTTLLSTGAVTAIQVPQQQQPPANRPTINWTRDNLQVLPKDTTVRDLVGLMRTFALGLGVRCQHCHVGEGDDLSTFDFTSDAKPAKALAREMMRLTTDINTRVNALVKTTTTGPRATCYTCHRGATKPETIVPEPGRGGGAGR